MPAERVVLCTSCRGVVTPVAPVDDIQVLLVLVDEDPEHEDVPEGCRRGRIASVKGKQIAATVWILDQVPPPILRELFVQLKIDLDKQVFT